MNPVLASQVVAQAVVDGQDLIKDAIKALAVARGVPAPVAELGAAQVAAVVVGAVERLAQVEITAGVAQVIDKR